MGRGSEEVKVSREGFAAGADFGFVGLRFLLGGGIVSAMEGIGGAETATESFTGITSCTGSNFLAGLADSGAVR